MTYPLHGGQLRQIDERFGIPVEELLDFSANINPGGPPPSVLSALRASVDDLATLTEYPDLQETDLRRSIARYAGTSEECVSVANGFVPLLDATLRALKIRSCLLLVPAFVEYRRTLERCEVNVMTYQLSAESLFSYDPPALLTGQHGAILVANPQNPSGVCHDAATVRDLVAKAAEKKMYVLLDEAFIDYLPEQSLTGATDEFPNLIVFRSVTKFHGIPGLRVAYAVADPALAASIRDVLPPWPITTLAARGVIAALEDQAYADRTRSDNVLRRTALQRELESMRLKVYPSAANFLLFRLPQAIDADEFWQRLIVDHRIVLRSCANYEGLAKGYFRAAIRTMEENHRLVGAIEKVIASRQ